MILKVNDTKKQMENIEYQTKIHLLMEERLAKQTWFPTNFQFHSDSIIPCFPQKEIHCKVTASRQASFLK